MHDMCRKLPNLPNAERNKGTKTRERNEIRKKIRGLIKKEKENKINAIA